MTQTICGHEIALASGKRYVASREMMCRPVAFYIVRIVSMDVGILCRVIPGLTIAEADAFLAEFNNDPRGSLYGRTW